MKQLLILFASTTLLYSCTGNDANSAEAAKEDSIKHARILEAVNDTANFTSIQWVDSLQQELGKVQEGQVVEVTWKFKNSGNKPLIITNASASCGCTVAEKPEEPIAPGGEGLIKAKFDSKGREGAQRKDVYVTANTTGSTNHQLSFAIEVQKQ
jgi:hypothetical protein